MGGVQFVPIRGGRTQEPILWQVPFPQWIQQALVSFDNQQGTTITNSELELNVFKSDLGAIIHARGNAIQHY